jgi:hypothetical protein
VERWFGIITQRAIRRGSFSSVKELIAKIEQFVAARNKTKTPFNAGLIQSFTLAFPVVAASPSPAVP